jgi:hypothetical protein
MAASGEAWVTYFEAGPLRVKLEALRFCEVEDLGPREIASRWFPARWGRRAGKGRSCRARVDENPHRLIAMRFFRPVSRVR